MNKRHWIPALLTLSLLANGGLLWWWKHPPAPAPDKPRVPIIHTGEEKFDFSGTGLEDDSWKLDEPKPDTGDLLPDKLPDVPILKTPDAGTSATEEAPR